MVGRLVRTQRCSRRGAGTPGGVRQCSRRFRAALPVASPAVSSNPQVTYRLVTTLAETQTALGVCRAVWGEDSVRDTDAYFVAATHGSYFATAWMGDEPVGAAFGFLSNGGRGLHSHMAGVLPAFSGQGIGLGLKLHQQQWAATQGIDTITWTFDPLVRRNAWFNLARLHVTVTDYAINYYGALGDAINGDDESDRLFVSWPVNPTASIESVRVITPSPGDVLVATPDDIEGIRPNGADADGLTSHDWRIRMRAELGDRLANGYTLVGLTSDYQYVLRKL